MPEESPETAPKQLNTVQNDSKSVPESGLEMGTLKTLSFKDALYGINVSKCPEHLPHRPQPL